jgi:hypothetical protein
MSIAKGRIDRLERDSGTCRICGASDDDKVTLVIRPIVVNSPEEIRQDRPTNYSGMGQALCPGCAHKPRRIRYVRVERASKEPS